VTCTTVTVTAPDEQAAHLALIAANAVRNGDLFKALELLEEVAAGDGEHQSLGPARVATPHQRAAPGSQVQCGDALHDLVRTGRGVEIPLTFRVLRAA
jgi:hypothetical protein